MFFYLRANNIGFSDRIVGVVLAPNNLLFQTFKNINVPPLSTLIISLLALLSNHMTAIASTLCNILIIVSSINLKCSDYACSWGIGTDMQGTEPVKLCFS